MSISLIAAIDRNRVIGDGPNIPWLGQLPRDMNHFRAHTLGKTVVMGRKTYDAMDGPLKDRTNIVLTRDKNFVVPDGVIVCNSVDEILQFSNNRKEVMIIGGAEIYALFLHAAEMIFLTIIDHEFDGNVFFPLFDGLGTLSNEHIFWKLVSYEKHPADEKNAYAMSFVTFCHK